MSIPSNNAVPWNKGKLVGQKPPLKLKEIWAIRIRLQLSERYRDLAMFNLAIDSKLRGSDLVKIKFLSPMKAEWVSEITEDGLDDHEAYFIDQGKKLPFPLSYWQHKHIVRKVSNDRSLIIDDISYKAGNPIFTFLLFPALYFTFYCRKAIYRRYFQKLK